MTDMPQRTPPPESQRKTLNLCCGHDQWGTDRLDWKDYGDKGITLFDMNSKKNCPIQTTLSMRSDSMEQYSISFINKRHWKNVIGS